MTEKMHPLAALSMRHILVLSLLLTVAARSFAQDVVAQEPESIAATLLKAGIPQNQDVLGPGAINTPVDSPFQWGPFVLRPHFLYRFLYGDGIQYTPGHPLVTAIDTFSPGFLLAEAKAWTFDYTPTWNLYSNHKLRDTVDESVNFLASNTFDDWTLQFAQSYTYSAEPLVETGSQTSQQSYSTNLDISRRLSGKVLVDFGLGQELQYNVGYPDTFEWSNQDWLHYRFSPHFDTALGTQIGYDEESKGSNSAFGRPEVQVSWSPTDKISLSFTGGLEHREYYGNSSPVLNTPIFNASLEYTPVKNTKFSLSAARQVSPALFENQSSRNTQWNASIEQRLLKHFQLSEIVEYDTVSYLASNDLLASVRKDEVLSYNTRLSTTVLRRGTIAILYQRSHDSSSVPGFTYSSSQIGLELSYRY